MGSSLVEQAKRRIERVRKTGVRVCVTQDGQPVEGARVSLRMKGHDYLFGAVCYHYGRFGDANKDARFSELFTPLLNYTMMPVHWNWYEPERHQYNEPYVGNLVDWAQRHGIRRKMHALIWHECCPEWVKDGMDIKGLYEEHINHLMRRYAGRFDFYDLINESTVSDRFDNPVSRWMKQFGQVNVARFGERLVRAIEPDAKLIYGEWNVHGREYLDFLRDLREGGVGLNAIGLQSHMHRDLWTQEETLRVMDEAARFGWPIHFPEISICSGKPVGEMSYLPGARNTFLETEEDLYWQADFARDFYTLVFSHPATEALSWFDFVDHRWLGAPAGLVDDTLNPKPVYHALADLIHRQWASSARLTTGTDGSALTQLFFGRYELEVASGSLRSRQELDFKRPSFYEGGAEQRVCVDL
ncbi:MAG: endo-1,4-beta-xylanase [Christensenellales bacterium]